jgi:excisionase family DNA binding protein
MLIVEGGEAVEALPLVMTVTELQKVLGLSRVKAYELVHQRNFPAIRFGRAIRIPRDGLMKWLDSSGGVPRAASTPE